MNKTAWIIIGAVIIVGGLAFWYFSSDDSEEMTAQQNQETTEQSQEQPVNEDQTSTPQDEASAIEEAKLVAVGNYTGSGEATRTIEGEFVHEVTAQLDDPTPGDFYEGWLVGPSVVSSGKLEREGDGQWSLVFTSEQDLSMHNQIVITEETEANGLDGIPEDHVLEGSF